ncbi:hypothetical protein Nmel_000186 [Mimus melanotis]
MSREQKQLVQICTAVSAGLRSRVISRDTFLPDLLCK